VTHQARSTTTDKRRFRYQSTAYVYSTKDESTIYLLITVTLVFSTTEMKDQQTQLLAMDSMACPPWFVWQNNSGSDHCHSCTCINGTDIAVKCDQLAQRSYLLLGYYMTYNNSSGNTFLGKDIYCTTQKPTDHLYLELPTNISYLNDFMCGPLNRKRLTLQGLLGWVWTCSIYHWQCM